MVTAGPAAKKARCSAERTVELLTPNYALTMAGDIPGKADQNDTLPLSGHLQELSFAALGRIEGADTR